MNEPAVARALRELGALLYGTPIGPRTCVICLKMLVSKREDAKLCSYRCRQEFAVRRREAKA